MKRIVICSDGTWDSPIKDRPTNVLRLSRGIQPIDSAGNEQVVFYDWGVGSDRKKITGGISGVGIDKNIMDCYRFIIHNYDPGDELFFFGFSRGAYTVRSLGGFIRNCGILRREKADQIGAAYKLYRRRSKASSPTAAEATAFRSANAVADRSSIRFLGIWDTVGALGIPLPFIGTLGDDKYMFHDTEPSSIIDLARHAVSIDEVREDFLPTLWDPKPGLDLKQVWFAGVHRDVGGGYPESGLSDFALNWLLGEATSAQLKVEDHLTRSVAPNASDTQHNEYKGFYRTLKRKAIRTLPAGAKIHRSVKQRWDNVPAYRKGKALKSFLDGVGNDWNAVDLVG